MADDSKNGITPTIARVVADLSREDGRLAGALEQLAVQVQDAVVHIHSLDCDEHRRQLAEVATRLDAKHKRIDELDARLSEIYKRGEQRSNAMEKEGKSAHDWRSPSSTYRAIDQHVEQVEDSLTDRINLAAIGAAREAVHAEMEEKAARVKLETDEQISKAKLELEQTTVRAARFKIWGVSIVGVIVAMAGAVGWKSCAILEATQARTEATLKRIEVKAAVKPPDAGVK